MKTVTTLAGSMVESYLQIDKTEKLCKLSNIGNKTVYCHNNFTNYINLEAVVGTFNQEKALNKKCVKIVPSSEHIYWNQYLSYFIYTFIANSQYPNCYPP